MIFYTSFCLLLSIINGCPFTSFEEALIPKNEYFTKFSYMIPTLNEIDSFSFGYWGMNRPKMDMLVDIQYASLFEINKYENFPQIFVKQNFVMEESQYQIIFTILSSNFIQVIKTYPIIQYSDRWIFTLFTFQDKYSTLILEMTGQQKEIFKFDEPILQQSYTYSFQMGDTLAIFQFSGRMSKIIFFENYVYNVDTFDNFSISCKIPPVIIGEQQILIISSITNFLGDKFIQSSLSQYGSKYCIKGWAKYYTQNFAISIKQILLRISSNKNTNYNKVFGDDLFKLTSLISKQQPQKSKITVTIDTFCYNKEQVSICQAITNQNGLFMNFYFEFQNANDYSFSEGLQQWHYFQYEYGREINEKFELLFQIQFFNSIGYLQKAISDEIYKSTWTNGLFYIFIGEKNNQYDYLQASIYALEFIHNYDQNKEFLLVCHQTCYTCNGPFVNNCLSCDDKQKRIFIRETNQCMCQDGFFELEIGSTDCSTVDNFFYTLEVSQILNENENLCQQGYFSKIDNDLSIRCIQCPQQNTGSYFCYDCLVGSNSWSGSLLCSKDLGSRGMNIEDGYILQDRSIQATDLYFIDLQFNLIYLPGYQGYCDLNFNENNCFLIQAIKNINKINKGGFCKPNYFYFQGECVKRDYECLLFSNEGDCLQCLDNQYLKNKRCFNCPYKCLNCFYNANQQLLQCLKCENKYGLLYGECKKCGINCQICEEVQPDKNKPFYYLKCFKCIDDQEFFVSNDLVNCKKNEIQDCKYIIQLTTTRSAEDFIPDSDQENIMTSCALCKTSPINDIINRKCINDPEIIKNNQEIQQFGCVQLIKSRVLEICTLYAQITSIPFYEQCNLNIENCLQCQKVDPVKLDYICLLCNQGYFADRLSGQCQICPLDQNCLDCGQQQKRSKDYWTNEIRPFIKNIIETSDYTFLQNMQSQEISDYEIFCKICQEGFSLVDGLCIAECPKSCLECQLINLQFQCIRCPQVNNKIQLTIIDNQCIQCFNTCSLCRIRNNDEIYAINPQFNDELYIQNSYQCLQSIENQNLFYDNEIGRYIQCDQNKLCYNQIQINLNLICSEIDYYAKLNQLSDKKLQKEFQQRNILITDLFSATSSFEQFQNHIFYKYANYDAIKTIIIVIESSQQQICSVGPFTKIDQTFAEHIFSLKNVELQMNFTQFVEFQLEGNVYILNFHKIMFRNVIFTSIKSNFDKIIKFSSIYQQQIQFYNFQLNQQSLNQDDKMFIEISYIQLLEIFGFVIQNLFLNNSNNYFFTVSYLSFQKNIIIKDVQIKNCILNNYNLFNFYIGFFDYLLFDNISVVSTFNNSKLITLNIKDALNFNNQIYENVQISNIMLQSRVYNTESLFQIESNQQVKFKNITISNSQIVNSTIINLNKQINLNNLKLINSEIKQDSIILFNVEQSENQELIIKNLHFENNQYDFTTHFIYFRKLNILQLNVDIINLILINNIGNYFQKSYKYFEKSLIYIEAHQILIQRFLLLKGYGISELFIKEADNFTLLYSEIRQDDIFKFKGLHYYIDCVLRKLDKITYVQAISIYSTKKTHIENMIISNLQLINFPIILYKSAEVEIKEQQEIFQLEAIFIENNFLLQTDSAAIMSIIFVNSQQIMQIKLNKINFQNNLFHSYQQNYLQKSSTLINIDSFESEISINFSTFKNNLVTNSTDSIIYINCQSIQITHCNFSYNSIFDYQILQPYIKWGFSEEVVYLEQIELIFPVISETGNGLLIGQNISISNTKIQESKGQEGGGFKILGQKDSVLYFRNITLNNISTIFSQQSELGGAFYIDGTQTQTTKVYFDQISGENIYCKNFGGFLYLKFKNQFVEIFISNTNMKDVQSEIGSLIYLDFTSLASNQQSLRISNLTIINSQESFERFLFNFKIFLRDDTNQIESNRTLIYCDYGTNISFNNLKIISLFQEGLFQINGIQSIEIQNIDILNCNFNGSFIKIYPFEYLQQTILIKDLVMRNITQLSYSFNYNCLQQVKEIKSNQLICLNFEETAPLNLDKYLLDYDTERQFKICLGNQLQNQGQIISLGLIIVSGINNLSKTKFAKIILDQINCVNCEKGLIYLQFKSTSEQILQTSFFEQIQITNSICGYEGCLNFEKQSDSGSIINKNLYSIQNLIWSSEIYIFDYICKNNTATSGTCIAINNLKSSLYQSKLISNNAKSYGGAIYIAGKQLFVLNNCQILNNTAFIGGGFYFEQEQQVNYSNFQNLISNNTATFYGQDFKLVPEGLFLYFSNNIPLEFVTIILNSTLKIVEAGRYQQQIIKLPCGQKLNSYQYFDPFDHSWSKQLDNTFCIIQSRQINNENGQNSFEFTNNFTNIKQVNFNSIEQEYSFENLIIYFDSNVSSDNFLQLDFQCNSVFVPIYDDQFPFKLNNQHQNYHLRINIQTLPCQYGEIRNLTDKSCHLCDADQGFFSLQLNSPKCEIKDEISTLSVQSALLELRPGYWRPYFDSNEITYCQNFPDNCLGGWIEGDFSCYIGHIGALCEQCDVHNIRGDGSFAQSEKFYCNSCSDQSKNITIITLTVIWTLLTLFFSVQGNLKMLDEFSKPLFTYQQRVTFKLNQPKTGALMKMLTNYFQIIASLATFQLNFSVGIENFLNIAGNPIQTTANSQDCFLKDFFSIQIQYARTTWLIIMPFFYIGTFLLIYFIGTYLKFTQSFNWSIIVTSLLHTYIYFQPNMIGGLMQLLSFREISGYQWVKANVSTRFDSKLHYLWMLEFALPTLIILALIIPFLLFYLLFKNKQSFDQKRIRKILGYLYHEYKPQAYYWEILKIFQKEFIIIFLNFYEENIVVKGVLVLLTSYAYSLLNSKYKPFQSQSLNMLDQASTNVCTISFGLAIGLYVAQLQKISELQIPFWIILSYYNIVFLVEIIYKIFIEYVNNFQKAIDGLLENIGAKFPFIFRLPWAKRFIVNRIKTKSRIKYLISKLQNYLMPLAKNTLSYKKTLSKSYQSQYTSLSEQNWKQGKFSSQNSEKLFFENEKAEFYYVIQQKFKHLSNKFEQNYTKDN